MLPAFVTAELLAALLRRDPAPVLADVRWYADGRSPASAFAEGHLPGAVRVSVDSVLAAPPSEGEGRHPLPDPDTFARGLGAAGIGDTSRVVAYDDAGGVIAARLVWMLRSLGHEAALLDGGLAAWPGPVEAGAGAPPPAASFTARPWPDTLIADIEEVAERAGGADLVLLDARPRERYLGAPDDLDPRAGHIPGAVSLPCRENVDAEGRLLAAEELRRRLADAGVDGRREVISSCGSGITACHTLLVMEHLGLPPGRLYPGSWSQWSRSDRPGEGA